MKTKRVSKTKTTEDIEKASIKEDTVVRSFRIPVQLAKDVDVKIAAFGSNKSEFFRQALIENKTEVIARKKVSEINLEALHQIVKEGNNLNQLARTLHLAKIEGGISRNEYINALTVLAVIGERNAEFALQVRS